MNDDQYTLESGHLDVGDGHKIYYQRWGNPDAVPTFYLHGGPGSGCKDKHKLAYDPKKHHIVFHDQRGCGNSAPFASTENNTTDDLIGDIEKLRKKLGFETIQLTGGSWGSFLALAYAVTYPDHVKKMLLRGIFTGTKAELDYIQQGGLATHYPDAWQQYNELVPEDQQGNTVAYYLEKLQNGSQEEKQKHMRRWVLLESAAMSIDDDFENVKLKTEDFDETSLALALLEAHYFINNCFKDDDFLYSNVAKLSSIPTVMVHGRFDMVCPPENAHRLAESIGKSCHLHFVSAGHGNDPALRETFRAYAWAFLD